MAIDVTFGRGGVSTPLGVFFIMLTFALVSSSFRVEVGQGAESD